ncbi:GRIP1-associated protein, putative [Entamoeba dispar SAW760]|uniref:GRIP1-associated protein, putative n=1 Tax=Entamoeba dispar (strain ATCC PRA-260 / SAW760) TaxID=370354 RepID=B0EGY9_ENTDS|nr:GRIP1-associated protein, putative [Entamoeba dispar SAW760]EDR26204.1 GRIP1-associated protein, putative [Entamoeba dispar SAW760]|eukprot:EDR26204.1 GRIP1-associated protein, putative [Entamoeba dispar SAW760]
MVEKENLVEKIVIVEKEILENYYAIDQLDKRITSYIRERISEINSDEDDIKLKKAQTKLIKSYRALKYEQDHNPKLEKQLKEIYNQTQEIKQKADIVNAKDEDYHKHTYNLTKIDSQIRTLQETFTSLYTKKLSLQEKINTLLEQENSLKDELDKIKEDSNTIQQTIEHKEIELEDKSNVISQLKNQEEEIRGDIRQIQREINELEKEQKQIQKEFKEELNQVNTMLENERKNNNKLVEQLQTEKASIEKETTDMEQEFQKNEKSIEEKKVFIEQMKKKIDELKKEDKQITKEVEKAEKDVKIALNKRKAINDRFNEQNHDIEMRRKELEFTGINDSYNQDLIGFDDNFQHHIQKTQKDVLYDRQKTANKFEVLLNRVEGKEVTEINEEEVQKRVEEELKQINSDNKVLTPIISSPSESEEEEIIGSKIQALQEIEEIIKTGPILEREPEEKIKMKEQIQILQRENELKQNQLQKEEECLIKEEENNKKLKESVEEINERISKIADIVGLSSTSSFDVVVDKIMEMKKECDCLENKIKD